jgi:hypothetical protein
MSNEERSARDANGAWIARGEDYEVRRFAVKHGITQAQAQGLIRMHGSIREALDDALARLRAPKHDG